MSSVVFTIVQDNTQNWRSSIQDYKITVKNSNDDETQEEDDSDQESLFDENIIVGKPGTYENDDTETVSQLYVVQCLDKLINSLPASTTTTDSNPSYDFDDPSTPFDANSQKDVKRLRDYITEKNARVKTLLEYMVTSPTTKYAPHDGKFCITKKNHYSNSKDIFLVVFVWFGCCSGRFVPQNIYTDLRKATNLYHKLHNFTRADHWKRSTSDTHSSVGTPYVYKFTWNEDGKCYIPHAMREFIY